MNNFFHKDVVQIIKEIIGKKYNITKNFTDFYICFKG